MDNLWVSDSCSLRVKQLFTDLITRNKQTNKVHERCVCFETTAHLTSARLLPNTVRGQRTLQCQPSCLCQWRRCGSVAPGELVAVSTHCTGSEFPVPVYNGVHDAALEGLVGRK